ncbi:MAG: hypothetical protein OXG11_06580 [Chloroflexi bacterium]|nr:hypothetical protein [Chloroflexota bacterium]
MIGAVAHVPADLAIWLIRAMVPVPAALAEATTIIPGGTIVVVMVLAVAFLATLGVVESDRLERRAKQLEDRIRDAQDFDAKDVFVSSNLTGVLTGIAIDIGRRTILLADETDGIRRFEASQIVRSEILQDKVQLAFVNRGSQLARAAVGGILMGGVAAAVGALTASKRSVDNVQKVILRLVTDDFDQPTFDIVLLDHSIRKKGIKRSSSLYQEALQVAELWHSRVSALLIKAEDSGGARGGNDDA